MNDLHLINYPQEHSYPCNLDELSDYIGKPDLHYMTQDCIATQLHTALEDVYQITSLISVFHSVLTVFHSPSDPSGIHGMQHERIHSTPLWRGCGPQHDTAFIVEDDEKPGIRGMSIVRVLLFFSFNLDGIHYPCALVEWFKRVRCDAITGMWIVCPEPTHTRRDKSVLHLDAFLHAAHLIPVFGNQTVPHDFDCRYTLDAFDAYYVNKYIDHHAYEMIF